MLNDEKFSDIRVLGRMWHGIYQGCLDNNFNEEQAFALLCVWIIGNTNKGIQLPTIPGPPTDNPKGT